MSVITPQTKTAIILFNLGGPDKLQAVQPFLFNLFRDPAILSLPNPFRTLLAKFISARRAPKAREIYEHIGGKSPLLEETEKQKTALEEKLSAHGETKCFICMRYWHPMSEETVKQVMDYSPDHIILLPLYPQYSAATTGSSLDDWKKEATRQGMTIPTTAICCYPTETNFIVSHIAQIRKIYFNAGEISAPRILFSAHGLPEKNIRAGDPYQWQVEQTVEKIIELMHIPNLDYVTCYQSRVGPLKWIGPSTEEEILRAGKENKPVMLVPVAFVSEHSETLVELDIEYKDLAEKNGVPAYFRVPTLSAQEDYIAALAKLCLSVKKEDRICSHKANRICPKQCVKCPNQKN